MKKLHLIKIKKHIVLYLLFLSLFTIGTSFGQSKKQKQLEVQRQKVLREIREIHSLLSNTKKEKTSLLAQIENVNLKVKVRQNLIKITNQQANLLNREIKSNNTQISNLQTDLFLRKKDYAKVVVNSYKNNAKQSKLMFLLSSNNFLQAYKRYNYMKQYKSFQKKLADSIVSKTKKLHQLNTSLSIQKKAKKKLISENTIEKTKLLKEKLEQKKLITTLQKQSNTFKKRIAKKEKESNALDRKIDKLINAAIAKSNKKAGKNKKAKTFALTAESKKLAASFTANKGKLPWPVKNGRITKRFGKQPHPIMSGIYTHNSGVEIMTSKNSKVRAVFDGTVLVVQKIKGSTQAVYVRHGNYLTVYVYLKEVYVKKGDVVNTKQNIGVVATNSDGRNVLKFLLIKNKTKQNPVKWIYKMR